MATSDVPGSYQAKQDVLAPMNWADHPDGSLILVYEVSSKRVIFSIFDLVNDIEFKSDMSRKEFERKFSANSDKQKNDPKEVWSWHDKTPFPWGKVLSVSPAGTSKDMQRLSKISDTAASKVGSAITSKYSNIDRETLAEKSKFFASKLSKWFSR